jgi:hypothetical protein
MKGAVVFLLGVILGAVVCVATTNYLAQKPGSTTAESVEHVGRAVEETVAGGIRRIHGESGAAQSRSADGDGTMTREASTPLRAKNVARLDQLVVRTKAAQAARRLEWMFVSESALVGELGPPDEIIPLPKGGENWEYEIPYTNAAGEKQSGTLVLQMQRARVVSISGADDIPE